MVKPDVQELLRQIPSVDELLKTERIEEAIRRSPRNLVLESIRQVLDEKRKRLLNKRENEHAVSLEIPHIVELVLERLDALSEYTLQPVINGSGVIIHTNLGRSLLPRDAVERLQLLSISYNNLEYDLAKGQRGSRYVHADSILRELTGAEAALVVNNNAGAVFLVLNTLAKGKEVVVSRGQLVEIGGSFRIPDVMESSGAILREVGCTNRTHLRDYESAINDQTALLLKVHCSNYQVVGFTSEVSLEDLAGLGRRTSLPVMEDLGSGSFVDMTRFGLQREPTVQEAVFAGADVVTFSGDKLLGGPQAGIIIGRKDIIDRCKKNPLTRALRVDKMTLAALESVLRLYRDESQALEAIPTLRMIATPSPVLEGRALQLTSLIREGQRENQVLQIEVLPGFSQVGGGSLPGQTLPTFLVAVHSPYISTSRIEASLRGNKPPVVGRIEADKFLLDVRTIQPDDFPIIRDAFRRLEQSRA
jgi:L-seryl-tRNA(Ser) seleniumtransferase